MAKGRVLVTGSSRGIGRAIALKLGEAGWKVAVHFANQFAEAESVVSELGEAAAGLYGADLSDPSAVEDLFDFVTKDGDLDALVNNAGVYLPLDLASASDENFAENYRRTMSINFESPMRLTRLAVQHFLSRGGGKVLNVASRVGFKGEAGASTYAASKAALINLTRSLAVELATHNIQLFALSPGWVDTAMARDGMDDRLTEILAGIPLGRMGSPDDCAAAAEFLLSDGAAYLSGICIDVNGASYFH